MDIQMPGMDGFEATAAIRELEKLTDGHIPIVAMTAHALVGDQQKCLASGMDGYVSKPIRTSELFASIERMLGDKLKPEHAALAKVLGPLIKHYTMQCSFCPTIATFPLHDSVTCCEWPQNPHDRLLLSCF